MIKNHLYSALKSSVNYRDVIIVFFWYSILWSKNSIFSIIVYQPMRETGSDRRQVRMMSPAVRRQRADVSLVVLSAPRPRDPLQLHLQQQWCIPPTATVWRIQALARRTVARGIVDQRLLDDVQALISYGETKQTSKGIPPPTCYVVVQLISRANAFRYQRRVNWTRHTESWNLTLVGVIVGRRGEGN